MPRIDANFLVANTFVRGDERAVFFDGEPVTEVPPDVDWPTLLVQAGIFASKSQVRQNWENLASKFGLSDFRIPPGWTDLDGIGKLKHRVTVLNPSRANLASEA